MLSLKFYTIYIMKLLEIQVWQFSRMINKNV